MKTGFYLCCVGIALMVIVEVSSQDQAILNEPVDKRGLYLESAQSQNAAAAAGKQSSSYLNVDGGYPGANYLGSVQGQAQPQFSAPGGWSGADGGSLQLGQQSSESALSHSSSNQYSKLIADGGYGIGGGQVVNSYPQFLPSGLSSLQDQSPQSGAAASAAAHSSGSPFQGSDGGLINPYYSNSGSPQYLQQNSPAEAAPSGQAGPTNFLDQLNYQHQTQPQRPFVQYPQEYYGSPNYSNGLLGSSGSAASAQASAGSSGAGALAGASAGAVSGLSDSGASASASSQSFQSQENPLVPRLKCGYVRQCKTVYEPTY